MVLASRSRLSTLLGGVALLALAIHVRPAGIGLPVLVGVGGALLPGATSSAALPSAARGMGGRGGGCSPCSRA
jgi:hypothetical protein